MRLITTPQRIEPRVFLIGVGALIACLVTLVGLAGCAADAPAPTSAELKATETAITRRVLATLTAQVRLTPTPDATDTPRPTRTPTPFNPTNTPRPTLTPTVTHTPTPTPAQVVYFKLELKGRILFWTDRDWTPTVYSMKPDGSEQIPLSDNPLLARLIYDYYAGRESRSPDGQWVAKVELVGEVPEIFIRRPDNTSPQRVTIGSAANYDPVWSPDSKWIAFVSQRDDNDEIYITDPRGRNQRRLTQNNWEWDKHPTWSPDSKRIAFWSNRETGRKQIWVMDASGEDPVNLSNNEWNDWDPVWVK